MSLPANFHRTPVRAGELRRWMSEDIRCMLARANEAGFDTADSLAILREAMDEKQAAHERSPYPAD